MQTIDLNGPKGNAFALMAIARDVCRQTQRVDQADSIEKQMMSGDYNNLLNVFEKNFGEYFELINKPEGEN